MKKLTLLLFGAILLLSFTKIEKQDLAEISLISSSCKWEQQQRDFQIELDYAFDSYYFGAYPGGDEFADWIRSEQLAFSKFQYEACESNEAYFTK